MPKVVHFYLDKADNLVYNKLANYAKNHKNLARLALLGVSAVDIIPKISLIALKIFEDLIILSVNVCGDLFFKNCSLQDAGKNAINILAVPVLLLGIPFIIARNLLNPTEAKVWVSY